MKHELSIVIITYNEQENLPRLLSSIDLNHELIVVDSKSEDTTVKIAKSYGARVFTRDFDNFGSQKNFAISKATKDWVLVLDADEQLSDHLNKSIHNFLNSNTSNKFNAYSLSRKLVFMDRKMNYGKTSDNPIRLLGVEWLIFRVRFMKSL